MEVCEHPEDKLPDGFEDALLDRREASAYLETIGIRRKPATLAKLYCIGADGPPCVHDGRRVLYPKRSLHLWGMRQLTAVRKSSREARAQMRPAASEEGLSP
jgi:hypothetical protein